MVSYYNKSQTYYKGVIIKGKSVLTDASPNIPVSVIREKFRKNHQYNVLCYTVTCQFY